MSIELAALKVLEAWESLPPGAHPVRETDEWINGPMWEAIMNLRRATPEKSLSDTSKLALRRYPA